MYLQTNLFGGPEVPAEEFIEYELLKPSVKARIASQWENRSSIRSIALNTGVEINVVTRIVKEHFSKLLLQMRDPEIAERLGLTSVAVGQRRRALGLPKSSAPTRHCRLQNKKVK